MRLIPEEPRRVPWWGLVLLVVGYALFVVAAQRIIGVSYDQIPATASSLLMAAALPVGIGAVALTVVTMLLGWWPQVLRDTRPIRPWLRALPVALAVIALVVLNVSALPRLGLAWVGAAALATLLIGYSEELLVRGLLLTGLRALGTERFAWFWSTFTFGALHILTALAGRAVLLSVLQSLSAFILGTLLYLARRGSGTIVAPMLLHALWDFALFTVVGGVLAGARPEVVGLTLRVALTLALFGATLVAIGVLAAGREAGSHEAPTLS